MLCFHLIFNHQMLDHLYITIQIILKFKFLEVLLSSNEIQVVMPNWFNYKSISWIRVKFQSIIVLNFNKPILKILLVKITFTQLKEHLLQSWSYGVDLCFKQIIMQIIFSPFQTGTPIKDEIWKEFKGFFWLFGCKYNF